MPSPRNLRRVSFDDKEYTPPRSRMPRSSTPAREPTPAPPHPPTAETDTESESETETETVESPTPPRRSIRIAIAASLASGNGDGSQAPTSSETNTGTSSGNNKLGEAITTIQECYKNGNANGGGMLFTPTGEVRTLTTELDNARRLGANSGAGFGLTRPPPPRPTHEEQILTIHRQFTSSPPKNSIVDIPPPSPSPTQTSSAITVTGTGTIITQTLEDYLLQQFQHIQDWCIRERKLLLVVTELVLVLTIFIVGMMVARVGFWWDVRKQIQMAAAAAAEMNQHHRTGASLHGHHVPVKADVYGSTGGGWKWF